MAQRRRTSVATNAAGRRRQQTSLLPGEIGKKALLQSLLTAKSFVLTKMMVADFQTPQSLATLLDNWDTGVVGLAPAASVYVFDLSTIGFTAAATFAPNTIIYVNLVKGGNTYTMKVDAADAFTASAVPGGAIAINAGACSINRATGALTLVTQAATDDLSGSTWTMEAFVVENVSGVTGAAPHGGGWGEADWNQPGGFVEVRHLNSAGGAFASVDEGMIYLQSLPAPGGGDFATTNFQAAFLISPYDQMKGNAQMLYSVSADPKAVLDPLDASWTAFAWDDVTDLAGNPLLYTTKLITAPGLPALSKILTLRIDMTLAIPETRTESTFVYGFAVGVN